MKKRFDKDLIGDISRIVLIVGFFSAIAFMMKRSDFFPLVVDIHTIRSTLQGGGLLSGKILSAVAFVFASGGLIGLGVPRLWASAVAGVIYGAVMGTFLSVLASLMGSSLLFLAGRTILAGVVERRMGNRIKEWQARFQENAFWWVLYGRFFPLSNSTVMSLLCGCCKISFSAFMAGSCIGFIPLAVVFATYGSGGAKGNIWQIGFATVLLVLSIFSRKIINRWFPGNMKGHDNATVPVGYNELSGKERSDWT